MPASINFTSTENGCEITISNKLRSGVRILFYIQFIVCLVFGALFFAMMFQSLDAPVLLSLFTAGAAVVYVLAAYRYIERVREKEIIHITPESISISKKKILGKETSIYEMKHIRNLRYELPPVYTDHPLKGESFDYLGFQTRDKEIQQLHDEGRLTFFYDGQEVRFGKMLASWDAEEIGEKIRDITGTTLDMGAESMQVA